VSEGGAPTPTSSLTRKRHKFSAVRTDCGHCPTPHPSKAEAKRCGDLHWLQDTGAIRDLEREPAFPFLVNGKRIFTYRADFSYVLNDERVIEDVKGMKTPIYKLKKKLVEAQYPGVQIVEVRG
jgi:hypothetical protein